ncbi:unnamed protein product, partial [Brachionus calyciflorus]
KSEPVCGNEIVEVGEECDCGFKNRCQDQCCYDASYSSNHKRCKLRPNAKCSPTQGDCCSKNCHFFPAYKICSLENSCLREITCTGEDPLCPIKDSKYFKTNISECNLNSKLCADGNCIGSICEKFNMTQCILSGDIYDKNIDRSVHCRLACKGELTQNICMDSFEMKELVEKITKEKFIFQTGSMCMNGLGYCDVNNRCKPFEAKGPLFKIVFFIFNEKTLEVYDFLNENTASISAIFLVVLGLILTFKLIACLFYSK